MRLATSPGSTEIAGGESDASDSAAACTSNKVRLRWFARTSLLARTVSSQTTTRAPLSAMMLRHPTGSSAGSIGTTVAPARTMPKYAIAQSG
jgi:hypothetical protein